jgi:hypothetical protein
VGRTDGGSAPDVGAGLLTFCLAILVHFAVTKLMQICSQFGSPAQPSQVVKQETISALALALEGW